MNSPKVVVSLGLALIFSVILTACGGGGSKPVTPAGPPTLETQTLPGGVVNQNPAYSAVLSAIGGTGAYTWSISSGSLPPGLSLNSSQGVISGTPTALGNYPFTAQVTDTKGLSATANLSIYIEGVVTIASAVLPSGSVGVAYTNSNGSAVQITASGGLAPYTWCVLATGVGCDPTQANLPPGLNLNTSTGVISGMPTTNGMPTTFMIQVTDAESAPGVPVSATSSFSIAIMSITTTSLAQGSAGVPYSATLTASGGVPFKGGSYNWSITAGQLPAGLKLDMTKGVISGAPTTIGNFDFTVQAVDNEKPPATASANLSISVVAAVTNANLSGNYVFTFNGYNKGTPVMMAGSFFADGQGHITYGELDYNNGSGEQGGHNPTPQITAASSTYSLTANGLGTMTLITNMSPPSPYIFNVSIMSDGSGRLIQSDPTQPQAYGSGVIMKHTPLAQGQQWPLCGSNVAVGLFGVGSSLTARYTAAGQFQFNPSTCVDFVSGVPGMDINDGGAPSSATFEGAFNEYDYVNSRGYVGITFKPGGVHTYAFYLVSSSDHKQNELVLVSTDPASQPAPLTLWTALPQPNLPKGWDNSSLANTAVAELNALDTNGAVDVTAGLFVGKGVAGNNCQGNNYDPATFNFDENQGGTLSLQQTSTGTYCVDKTTGRVTLTSFSSGPFATPPVFYMITANQAFVVGTDPAVTSGYFEQQTGSPFSTSSIFGLYSGGTVTPVLSTVTNAVTSLYADGSLNMNGVQDTSGPGGPGQNNFTYTYSVDGTGRAVVQQNGSTVAIMYVVTSEGSQTAPAKAVMLPTTDLSPALSIFTALLIP
jgi:hypothetical protein